MKRNSILIVGIIIYRVILDLIYESQISPFFSYWLLYNKSNLYSYIQSWILLTIFTIPVLAFYHSKKEDNYATSMFVLFLFYIKLVPLTSFHYYLPQSISFIIQQVIMWLLMFVLLYRNKPIVMKSFIVRNDKFIMAISILVSLAVVWVSGKYTGFRFHLNLDDVYDLRLEAREFNMPMLLKYVYSFAGNIIPICMTYYITRKNMRMFLLLSFIGLLNFSVAGSKSTLFRIVLCFVLFYAQKIDYKKWIMPTFTIITILSVLEFNVMNTINISTILVRRVLYIPNLLDSVYFNYLKNSEPFFFDTSRFTELQFKIGNDIFGNELMRCNNGFFTDAYVNLREAGCIIYPLIYTVLVKLLEGACLGQEKYVTAFSAFLFVTTLESTFFTTSLLTHGLFLMILTLYVMPIKDFKKSIVHNSDIPNSVK